jgi:hypothetical protein
VLCDDSKYLCNVVREGREKTCFQIWHQDWSNGNAILRLLLQDHKVRDRAPPSRPNKKRRCNSQARRDTPHRAASGLEASEEEDAESEHAAIDDEGNDVLGSTFMLLFSLLQSIETCFCFACIGQI